MFQGIFDLPVGEEKGEHCCRGSLLKTSERVQYVFHSGQQTHSHPLTSVFIVNVYNQHLNPRQWTLQESPVFIGSGFWSTVAKTQHTPTGARVHFRPVRHNYMASAEVKDSGWLKLFHPTPLMQRSNIASLHSFWFRRTLYRFNCNINRNFTQSLQLCRKFDQSLYSCYVHQSWQSSSLTSWTDFRETHFLVCRFERCRCLTFTYKTLLKTLQNNSLVFCVQAEGNCFAQCATSWWKTKESCRSTNTFWEKQPHNCWNNCRQQVRHITVTEAVSSKAIASMERIEVSESTSNLHV